MKKIFSTLIALVLITGCVGQTNLNRPTNNTNNTNTTTNQTVTALPTETWQIQGSSHSYEDGTKIVNNGSTLAYTFRYGEEAGSNLAGTTKLYYNPTPGPDGWTGGIRIANNNSTDTTPEALSNFSSLTTGVKAVCDQMNINACSDSYAYYIKAGQAIPLASEEKVRLFFEASDLSQGMSAATEIFYLDSLDGYVGEDYNTNSTALCGGSGSLDYAPGGNCEIHTAIAAGEDSGLAQARQFKIGYPVLDSWLWDEAVGTFMVITGEDTCGQTRDGLFYATWDSQSWNVVQDDQNCAQPLVPYAHGPVIVNTGNGTYKLYYEDRMMNELSNSLAKPLRYITADATRTGDPNIVDFEDWDSYEYAGEVDFLWPDGTPLTDAEESGLGDHFIFLPDGLDSAVMYLNLGGFDNIDNPQASTGLGMALPVE